MRHYYDIHELLKQPDDQNFIGTDAYKAHKQARFRQGENQNMAENQAFLLSDANARVTYANAYERSSALYYAGKPSFDEILAKIREWADKL
jgi:hypothetical protein